MDKSAIFCYLYIDLFKAFDSIDHGRLLEILFNLEIGGRILA